MQWWTHAKIYTKQQSEFKGHGVQSPPKPYVQGLLGCEGRQCVYARHAMPPVVDLPALASVARERGLARNKQPH
jgi:hypothetical protein